MERVQQTHEDSSSVPGVASRALPDPSQPSPPPPAMRPPQPPVFTATLPGRLFAQPAMPSFYFSTSPPRSTLLMRLRRCVFFSPDHDGGDGGDGDNELQ